MRFKNNGDYLHYSLGITGGWRGWGALSSGTSLALTIPRFSSFVQRA